MKIKFIIMLISFFLLSENNATFARPKNRSKSCVRKVLLPGHSKPVKCNKARKMKNSYF